VNSVGEMLRAVVLAALAYGASAQFGRKRQPDAANALREELNQEHVRAEHDAFGGAAQGAREWEMDNIARHKAGELNQAELGMENMKHAMNDPSAMREMAQMMQDPDNQRKVKEMMQDPSFQAQARQAMEQMKASGGLPDMSNVMNDPNMMAKVQKMMENPEMMAKAKAMAQAMYGGGGMAGSAAAGGGDGMAAEIARLRAENAALRQHA